MRFFAEVWTTVTTVTHWLVLSPLEDYGLLKSSQQPIGGLSHSPTQIQIPPPKPPLLTPPGSNLPDFECDYGPDWYDCRQEYPGCWIRNRNNNSLVYDIYTDYESDMPQGTVRNYTLYVTEQNVQNVDGINFTEAKLFNGVFPGPLLEACWGDTLNINVVNNMKWNGTSVHWHGIRQWQTVHMDGVNGITQCPIAPGDSFTYTWVARQYGSSWYHSHYSVQYADGLQGPITLHGPTSVDYDEAVTPLLTSDWLHNTAFSAELPNGDPDNPTILLNGTGNCQRFFADKPGGVPSSCGTPPNGFEYTFVSASPSGNGTTKYLFRIINTSYSTAITFSIDNHNLTVVEADFVPTSPNQTVSSLIVSIGQRYHVIVEALADPFAEESNGNFWIRTATAQCGDDITTYGTGWERTGIIRYNASSGADPTSQPWPGYNGSCIDNLTMLLEPVYKWNVTAPKNSNGGETFNITFQVPNPYALSFVAFQPQQGPMNGSLYPFQTTWGNPTFLNLDNDGDSWPNGWMVIPEDYTETDFVYLVLQNSGGHPIHLHGHDFAVVEYTNDGQPFDPTKGFNAPYTDLMRRDVILTPPNGYAVIAFKTDNPGPWLMHCHIAFHASGGLSLQIMERQSAANGIWPPNNSSALRAARKTCAGWNNWAYDCTNFWPGEQPSGSGTWPACGNVTNVQNDSGV